MTLNVEKEYSADLFLIETDVQDGICMDSQRKCHTMAVGRRRQAVELPERK